MRGLFARAFGIIVPGFAIVADRCRSSDARQGNAGKYDGRIEMIGGISNETSDSSDNNGCGRLARAFVAVLRQKNRCGLCLDCYRGWRSNRSWMRKVSHFCHAKMTQTELTT